MPTDQRKHCFFCKRSEAEAIKYAIKLSRTRAEAARMLGIKRTTLLARIRRSVSHAN